jgi:hypothetical protein
LIFLMMSEVSMLLLPSVARQLPILDVTWRSFFFVPSPPAELYWGNSTESMSFGRSVGCKDFSEIVVSSSIRRLFVFIQFWFDFITRWGTCALASIGFGMRGGCQMSDFRSSLIATK